MGWTLGPELVTLAQDILEAADVNCPRAGLRKGGVNETSWSLRWGQVQRREGKQKRQDSHHPCPPPREGFTPRRYFQGWNSERKRTLPRYGC